MSVYAIASICRGKKQVGIRLLDTDTSKVHNLENNKVLELLYRGKEIINIEREGNELNWIQGVVSRYPSVNLDTNNADNINAVTVLGLIEKEGVDREYLIANYMGNIITICESRLIEYGNKYAISNCKIVTKDNKSYVVSLNGNMVKIASEVKITYNHDTNQIVIDVPLTGANKVVIPKSIGYIIGENLYTEIYVTPVNKASTIKHLVLPETINVIGEYLLENLYGLEILECTGHMKKLEKTAFKHVPSLKKIYMKSVERYQLSYLNDLEQLTKVDFGDKVRSLPEGSFRNCKRLDISNIITEELLSIGYGSFANCASITDVVIPSSTRNMNSSAFIECKNIKSFRITSVDLDITPSEEYDSKKREYVVRKLLRDSPNAVLYCPYEYPDTRLGYVADHVKIIRDEPLPDDTNKVTKNKILKAQTLGFSVKDGDVASSIDETTGALQIATAKDVKDGMIEAVRLIVITDNFRSSVCSVRLGSLFVNVNIGISYGVRGEFIASNVGKDYAILVFEKRIMAVVISKEMILDMLEKNTQSNYMYAYIRNTGELVLPCLDCGIKRKHIKSINEKDGMVYVTSKSGEVAALSF